VERGFTAVQIHPTAPQSWGAPQVTPETAASFKEGLAANKITAAFFHNIYLCNFATETPGGWHGSISITQKYLTLSAQMGVQGVVAHVGSHKGAGMDAVIDRVVEGLCKALEEAPPESTFLIENTAGGGGTIGRTLEEIQMITDRVWPRFPNVGICIDTCHAFAAGIPIHEQSGLDAFVNDFESRFGLDALRCIHLNDSKMPFGSFKDRHENIGDGELGNAGLTPILTHPKLAKVPLIMEVPGIEKTGPDRANLERVQSLIKSA
jgi:deoxyribonuclease-4